MKRISLTNRTLVILAAALGLILMSGYFVTPKLMALVIKEYEQDKYQETAIILKERLIRYFPGSKEAREVAYSYADYFLQREERILIGPSFTGGGVGADIPVSPEKVISYLRKVANAQKEVMWKYNVFERLAEFYHSQGSYEDAEKNFLIAAEGFEKADKSYRIAEINRKLVNVYLETGKMEQALALVQHSLEKYSDHYRGEFLTQKGDIYFQLGEYSEAERYYRDALAQAEKDWAEFFADRGDKAENINATLDQQPVFRHSKLRLEKISSIQSGSVDKKGKVEGEILKGNLPMPNTMVYLVSEKEYDGRMSHFEGIEANSPYKTDKLGRFEFDGVLPGRYFLVLGVLPQDLNGLGRFKGLEAFTVGAGETIELKYVFQPQVKILEPVGQQSYMAGQQLKIMWEEVPLAAAYNLHITLKLENGYVSRAYRTNLKGSSYMFAPQDLALREMNFVARGDGYVLAPSAILGSFYPGAEIFLVIEAVDDEGRSISDSEGYILQLKGNYPSIQIKGAGPISSGDSLVTAKKYTEAEAAYLQELKKEPGNTNALLSLARLYNYGWAEGTADLKKAAGYYDQLLQIRRDKFLVEEAAGANVQLGNYHAAVRLYEEIEDEMSSSIYWFHHMGELYFKTGKINKALDYYQVYLNKEREFRDLGPVIAYLYKNDVEGAIKLLKENNYSQEMRYNRNGEAQNSADIRLLLNSLETYNNGVGSVISKDDFRNYLLEIVNIGGNNRFEQIRSFQTKVNSLGENDILVTVLKELAKDRG